MQKYRLDVLPHWRWTFIGARHTRKQLEREGVAHHVLPPPRWPGDRDIDHLLFSLRYDGVSLPICRALFGAADHHEMGRAVLEAVHDTPTGSYARRAWFLYETLTGERLPLPDVQQGNYVPLLDEEVHVVGPVTKHRRQRIDINTLGAVEFAPVVRRIPGVRAAHGQALRTRIEQLVDAYDDRTFRRAISFLYTRETMASFEIENERPASTRAERFIALLREAPRIESLSEHALVRLQSALVDHRFADEGWRDEQNYVGESLDLAHQRVHFVPPRPEDLEELMEGFLSMADALMRDDTVEPVLVAAVVSFAFVLLHPFRDGNGRIHRWLIHWALARSGVTRPDLVIPVSAVMLSHRREYDEALESYSVPLMQRVDYDLDGAGRMTVQGPTADLYRHPDLTLMAAALWRWLDLAVDRDLPDQLDFLVGMDGARRAIMEVVDMPDRLVDLFVKLCVQNGGTLSKRKRSAHFHMLTDGEIERMEAAVRERFPPSQA